MCVNIFQANLFSKCICHGVFLFTAISTGSENYRKMLNVWNFETTKLYQIDTVLIDKYALYYKDKQCNKIGKSSIQTQSSIG